jgi:hypothetical protein
MTEESARAETPNDAGTDVPPGPQADEMELEQSVTSDQSNLSKYLWWWLPSAVVLVSAASSWALTQYRLTASFAIVPWPWFQQVCISACAVIVAAIMALFFQLFRFLKWRMAQVTLNALKTLAVILCIFIGLLSSPVLLIFGAEDLGRRQQLDAAKTAFTEVGVLSSSVESWFTKPYQGPVRTTYWFKNTARDFSGQPIAAALLELSVHYMLRTSGMDPVYMADTLYEYALLKQQAGNLSEASAYTALADQCLAKAEIEKPTDFRLISSSHANSMFQKRGSYALHSYRRLWHRFYHAPRGNRHHYEEGYYLLPAAQYDAAILPKRVTEQFSPR